MHPCLHSTDLAPFGTLHSRTMPLRERIVPESNVRGCAESPFFTPPHSPTKKRRVNISRLNEPEDYLTKLPKPGHHYVSAKGVLIPCKRHPRHPPPKRATRLSAEKDNDKKPAVKTARPPSHGPELKRVMHPSGRKSSTNAIPPPKRAVNATYTHGICTTLC